VNRHSDMRRQADSMMAPLPVMGEGLKIRT